ncbi:MAG: class I SAM-dependent methyltransferase [Marmoricola sp.]
MDLPTLAWLLTPEGQALLDRATSLTTTAEATDLSIGATLRRDHAPDHVAAALTQVDLRRRAVAKFGDDAARMYWTPDGLEQATRRSVAEHRAARLRLAGLDTLIDLGCGVGGDLVATARAGLTVVGVDLDPVRVAIAQANLAALDLGGAVAQRDATEIDLTPFDIAYADPARRSARGRSFHPDDWSPSWSLVEQLFLRDACVKVAPGIPHERIPAHVEGEWVSDHGEVKEAALWCGRLSSTRRRATVIGNGGLATITDEDEVCDDVTPMSDYLYEPDGAVIRAGLVQAVAAGVQGSLIDPHIAYVTSSGAFRTPFARTYVVLEELPYRTKPLRAALRERGIGRLTIKKRGVAVVPEILRRDLAPRGENEGTIVMTRANGEGRCWLVRPLP